MTQGPGGTDDVAPPAAATPVGDVPATSTAESAGDPHLVPVDADGVVVVTVGTAIWWVAFLVLLVWPDHAGHGGSRGWLAITLAGGVLGLYGIYYTRRRRSAIRRSRGGGPQS